MQHTRLNEGCIYVDEFRQIVTFHWMTQPIEKVRSALRRLNLSDAQQTIYLSLLREGRATARILAARTGITRPSVYDQLKTLRRLGLIVELDIENKSHFAASDLTHLDALLEDQIDRISQSREFLKEALPSLIESLETVTPKIRFFEGADGCKQILKDVMWHNDTTLKIIWARGSFEDVFDNTFLTWFDERRVKRNLRASLLLTKKTTKLFTNSDDQQRLLPTDTQSKMTSIIFDTKVAFISSIAESYGFIVESKEFTQLQTMQFDSLWKNAK